jgi:hypothetical protein
MVKVTGEELFMFIRISAGIVCLVFGGLMAQGGEPGPSGGCGNGGGNAIPETQSQFGLSPSSASTLGALRVTTLKPVPPAAINAGGRVSITNVVSSGSTPLSQSNQPLLAHAEPVFSALKYSTVAFNAVTPASALQFTGVAMQNPRLETAIVSVSLYSPADTLMGTSVIAIPSGRRLINEISELTQGAAPVPGSYLVVSASRPIQIFGFTGDVAAGTVVPFAAAETWN